MVLCGWGRGGVLEGGIESEGAGWFSVLVHRKAADCYRQAADNSEAIANVMPFSNVLMEGFACSY